MIISTFYYSEKTAAKVFTTYLEIISLVDTDLESVTTTYYMMYYDVLLQHTFAVCTFCEWLSGYLRSPWVLPRSTLGKR